ncbi:hypothetical protein CPAR01_09838 [Colletotrichum paranaense]|uniref:C6 zinc finger domain-containing protein n=1 Tax=Colletotrichum paranaense TaxID=1914294 RepID=A0ABQ9SCB2_9PEZI|nr:uncharacterized protein CPAR01_09838 [Colletotrichum paranaense]KAK1533130.1 hypothetical protein CPAR01_09838 [Colletotrichum paranaense]
MSAEPATATLRSLVESLSRLSQPSTQRTWIYQAAQYYSRALELLKKAIYLLGPMEGAAESAETANVFAAVAMLGTFEMMDAPADGWRAHLDALPMFASTNTEAAFSPMTLPRITVKGSAFWNLVRLDLICAFVSERQTRLNLESIPSWQNAGLAVDDTGEVLAFSPFTSTRCDASSDIIEDAKSNELLWLLGKVINFLTAGDAMNPEDFALPLDQRLPLGVTQEQLLERWEVLDTELRKWQSGLPPTFEAIARTNTGCASMELEQIWYELPVCAAAMQTYHMVSILLLANRPQESTVIRSTLASRLRHYRTIPRRVLWHAREICGVNLADPVDSVRIHSILPLFIAGQVVDDPQEQSLIQDLLSSIETDLGWTTHYHRDKLYQGWIEMAQPV